MRVTSARLACIALAFAASAAARAGDLWGGSIGAVSDYVYRGISQTRGKPALQLGVYRDLGSGWSIGAWSSPVDYGERIDASYELDLSLTRSWLLANQWSARVAYTHYFYPGERGDYDYDEWVASLTYRDRLTATVAVSPNRSLYAYRHTAWRELATSYELAAVQPLSARWSITGGAGYYDLRELFGTGYWFWSFGLVFAWEGLQLDILHIATDSTAEHLFGEEQAGRRFSASVVWRF